jgi:hypothetical protein
MVTFLQDSFTAADGTLITARSGELGATWTVHSVYNPTPASGRNFAIENNGVFPTVGGSVVYASGVPGTDEYDVVADYKYVSNAGLTAICGRVDTAAATFYYVYHDGTQIILARMVSGTVTSMNAVAYTMTVGSTYEVKLQIRDAAKKVFINNVEIISHADNTITSVGRVGLRSLTVASATTGRHIMDIYAQDLIPPTLTTSDSGTISESSNTLVIAGTTTRTDADTVSGAESYSASRTMTTTDTDTVVGAFAYNIVTLITRTDADTISETNTLAISSLMTRTDADTISYTRTFTVVTGTPAVLNDFYRVDVAERSALIHDAARRYVGEEVQIISYHPGIFDVGGTLPTTPMDFIVLDQYREPRAVGTATSNWNTSTTTIYLSNNLQPYEAVLNSHGYGVELATG